MLEREWISGGGYCEAPEQHRFFRRNSAGSSTPCRWGGCHYFGIFSKNQKRKNPINRGFNLLGYSKML